MVKEKKTAELLPHDELLRIREELKHLKEHEIPPVKLQVTMQELNKKIDKLIDIFEDAMNSVQEEGGLTIKDQLQPVLDKLQEVLDENSKIADGIIALADIIKEEKGHSKIPPPLARIFPPLPKITGPRIPPPPSNKFPESNLPPPPPPKKKKRLFR